MKFLCMTCDAQMQVASNQRQSGEGTLAIVLECPECFGQFGMLTNPMETKLLDSLDVSVCPVGGKGRATQAVVDAGAASEASTEGAAAHAPEPACPVAGMALDASSSGASLTWTPEAEARLKSVPIFVRPLARRGVEGFARKHGHAVITPALMDDARKAAGM